MKAISIYAMAYNVLSIMKEISIAVFSDKEEKQARALQKLGLPRAPARIAVYLNTVSGHTASPKMIEVAANLRQPEVSNGMRILRKYGFVSGNYLQVRLSYVAKRLYEKVNKEQVGALETCCDEVQG